MSLHQPKSPVTGYQSNEVPANDNKEEVDHAKKKGGLSAFQWFIIGALIFGFCVIGLALGLGLGLGLKKTSPSSVVIGSTSNGNFNYSSYYGIPDNLPVISNNLTNTDELELRGLVAASIVTGKSKFSISDPPQVRNYVFNITQVLAAPDGYQKPMIAINGTFPIGLQVIGQDNFRDHWLRVIRGIRLLSMCSIQLRIGVPPFTGTGLNRRTRPGWTV
jgi:hypothetical protein